MRKRILSAAVSRHLVLGGSEGMGFAYAMHFAKRGDAVVLVARRAKGLSAAARSLRAAGAAHVTTYQLDLRKSRERLTLLRRLNTVPFETVLVGGPTPPPGHRRDVSHRSVTIAAEVCVAYPMEIMSWLLKRVSPIRAMAIISSSAVRETRENHPFFLSSIFRHATDMLVKTYKYDLEQHGTRVTVWYPRVVATPLALKYAKKLPPLPVRDSALNRLARVCGVRSIPLPEVFVNEMIEASNQ